MKQKLLFTFIFSVFSLISLAQVNEVLKAKLCKKWNLTGYEFLWMDYDPEPNEKNDYILFKESMKFESIDEGIYSTGEWKLTKKDGDDYIIMSNVEGEIGMKIEKITNNHLILIIDHEELFDLEIHFKAI